MEEASETQGARVVIPGALRQLTPALSQLGWATLDAGSGPGDSRPSPHEILSLLESQTDSSADQTAIILIPHDRDDEAALIGWLDHACSTLGAETRFLLVFRGEPLAGPALVRTMHMFGIAGAGRSVDTEMIADGASAALRREPLRLLQGTFRHDVLTRAHNLASAASRRSARLRSLSHTSTEAKQFRRALANMLALLPRSERFELPRHLSTSSALTRFAEHAASVGDEIAGFAREWFWVLRDVATSMTVAHGGDVGPLEERFPDPLGKGRPPMAPGRARAVVEMSLDQVEQTQRWLQSIRESWSRRGEDDGGDRHPVLALPTAADSVPWSLAEAWHAHNLHSPLEPLRGDGSSIQQTLLGLPWLPSELLRPECHPELLAPGERLESVAARFRDESARNLSALQSGGGVRVTPPSTSSSPTALSMHAENRVAVDSFEAGSTAQSAALRVVAAYCKHWAEGAALSIQHMRRFLLGYLDGFAAMLQPPSLYGDSTREVR